MRISNSEDGPMMWVIHYDDKLIAHIFICYPPPQFLYGHSVPSSEPGRLPNRSTNRSTEGNWAPPLESPRIIGFDIVKRLESIDNVKRIEID